MAWTLKAEFVRFIGRPDFDYDDNQSDIEIESGNDELDICYNETNVDDCVRDDLADVRGPSVSHRGDAQPLGPVYSTGHDGWSFDCSTAGAGVQPFLEPYGPSNNDLGLDAEPVDYFYKLLPESFFTLLAKQTNVYARQKEKEKNPNWILEMSKWNDTCTEEMRAFVSIYIFMGNCKLPNYRLYWSDDTTFNQQFVANNMPRNRFESLSSNFHMIDRDANPAHGHQGHDVLHKVRPLLNVVQKSWPDSYKPSRNICVNKAMVKFKGRCAFRQYLPAKPVKWGLKVWALCDSESYYMLHMSVYTGKKNDLVTENSSLGERVVKTLVQPYLGKHHVVYMDNYFTSLPLIQFLLEHDTYACGTIRNNRKGPPSHLKNPKVVKMPGQTARMYKDGIQTIAWFDKRKVLLLSSVHSADDNSVICCASGGIQEEYPRPHAIQEYFSYFSGVDKNDQLRSYYGIRAKAAKWWKYILWFCVEVSLINAYIIYCTSPGDPHQKLLTHLQFQTAVMKGLLGNFCARKRAGRPAKRVAQHEIVKIETKRGQRDCAHCKKEGRRTMNNKPVQTIKQCLACNVGLCSSCFDPYHGF